MNSIGNRIQDGRHVRAVNSAVAKPTADRYEPDDTERMTYNGYLRNILKVNVGIYKSITLQLQLNRTDSQSETPSPDRRRYLTKD